MARFKMGLQGILYDETIDRLLVCDTDNNRVITLNPITGTFIL